MGRIITGSIVLLSLSLIVGGCIKEEGEEMPKIEGKKIVMIFARENFRDEELEEPRVLLEKQGGEVTLASSSLEEARGMLGARVTPDILVGDVKVEEYDAVVFVGGSGASEYWEDPVAHEIARKAVGLGKLVCAICIAPVTLANAGVLEGRKAAVFGSERGKLEAKGGIYTNSSVEVDGNIITADGPGSAGKFGKAIMKALANG